MNRKSNSAPAVYHLAQTDDTNFCYLERQSNYL